MHRHIGNPIRWRFPRSAPAPMAMSVALAVMLAAAAGRAQRPAPGPIAAAGHATAAAAPLADPRPGADAAPAPGPEYVLGPGDVLAIDVFGEAELSRTLPVRPDGRLILPLVGEIQAQGLTSDALQALITRRLTKYIANPNVAVMLEDAESHRVNVMGMVMKPGSYALGRPTTILDAIAAAGGLADYAHGNRIYVIRKRANGSEQRIDFNYGAMMKGQHPEQNILLQQDDTVVIP